MNSLIKKIEDTIYKNRLIEVGDKVVLAVSGGPDSICMLDVLAKINNYNQSVKQSPEPIDRKIGQNTPGTN